MTDITDERLETIKIIYSDLKSTSVYGEHAELASELLKARERIAELEKQVEESINSIKVAHDRELTKAKDHITELEMGSDWVKRSERNPKKRGAYLVYKAGLDEITICNFGTSKGWENGRNIGVDNSYRVTHWKPLPSPPKD